VKLSVLKKNQLISETDLSELILEGKFAETVFLIGRSKECHIILDEKQISREHSKLIHLNGKWRIEKLSQDTPLLLNSVPIDSSYLSNGDTVTINPFVIEFAIPEPKPISSPAPVVPTIKEALPVPVPEPVVPEPEEKTDEISFEVANTENIDDKNEDNSDIVHDRTSTGTSEVTSEFILDSGAESAHGDLSIDGDAPLVMENNSNELDSFETDSEAATDLALTESSHNETTDSPSYSLENISNDDSEDNDKTQVSKDFANVNLELFGEFAPYDKYILESGKTNIGRDSTKCKIVLNDPEVSSLHAVIIRNNMLITLEDLKSGNGTLLNGERINKATLNHNDEFIIGSTSFKLKVRSEFLKEEHDTLMPVEQDQTIEIEQVVEEQIEEGEKLDALGGVASDEPQEKSIIKRILKDEEKRKKLIYALVVIVGAWVMFGDEPPAQKTATSKKDAKSKDVAGDKTDKNDKADKDKADKDKNDNLKAPNNVAKKLSDEEKRALSERYQIGKKHFQEGRYRDALEELQKVASVDPHFNASLQTLIAEAKTGLGKLEEQEKKRKEEEAIAEKKTKVKELVARAKEYVKDHRADLAEETFNAVAKLDPENLEISRLKREMEDWTKEKQKKELEIAQKKKDREDKLEKSKPSKALFVQKDWFRAAAKLEEFIKIKDMDEDLVKDATEMLKTSREEISNAVSPLQGKAKSLMEGQDLKGAYEVYLQILKVEPSNAEALNAVGEIKDTLNAKARKIYREAIISESLSLFQDAKEKFQEVQQISPVDSDYYKRATDKLKDYLE
jgi:pSer/pThr/pTyr-binding forkhead associated (FHA) protein